MGKMMLKRYCNEEGCNLTSRRFVQQVFHPKSNAELTGAERTVQKMIVLAALVGERYCNSTGCDFSRKEFIPENSTKNFLYNFLI